MISTLFDPVIYLLPAYLFLSSSNVIYYLVEFIGKSKPVSVCFTRENCLDRAVFPGFDSGPKSFVRTKENQYQGADQAKPADIPGDENGLVRIVFYRKNVCERRFFKFGQSPLIA